MAATEKQTEIRVTPLRRGSATLRIVGMTPLYQNRMASKAKQELLCGGKRKTQAERAEIKHDPMAEFLAAAEIVPTGPTALGLSTIAIKSAMSTAALETAGVTKSSSQRLLFIPGDRVPLYGTPLLKMDVTRLANMGRTPDIRTRPFLPHWGAEVEVHFITPQLSVTSVVNLLFNAGIVVGVGDYRQEKGKGNYGTFRVLTEGEEDSEWDDLVKNHGRKAQEAALQHPQLADQDTADLMAFWDEEFNKRSAGVVLPLAKRGKTANGKETHASR